MKSIYNLAKSTRKILKSLLYCMLLFIGLIKAQAIILYSGDNSINLTPPDAARTNIFNSVAKICEANGEGMSGSSVYLKGKYLLTAKHVLYQNPPNQDILKADIKTHVTFNGVDLWEIDYGFNPIQISNTDLIIFKLLYNPNLSETQLNASTNERFKSTSSTCLIGWGFGRDSEQIINSSDPRAWERSNDTSTIMKRWGTNKVYTTGSGLVSGYNYSYLMTILNANSGNNEAAVTYLDSGGGLFLNNSGTWQLAGISTAVSNPGISNFTDNPNFWHQNIFIRISQYRQIILDNIPDTSTYAGWAIDNSLYGTEAETNVDSDGDSLDNQTEFNLGTNPNLADSDNDGLSDGLEVNTYNTDPLDNDTDTDGLNDGDEINNYNTNPLNADTDGDGLNDQVELNTFGTNPNNSDSDADGLSDNDEINTLNTNPNNADSDNDGLSDSDEINVYQCNPNNSDTSNDGFNDQALVSYGLDPNVDHTLLYDAIEQSFADLRAGSTIIEVINNQATIRLNLESSYDLSSWSETDNTAIIQVSANNETQFYRFKLID